VIAMTGGGLAKIVIQAVEEVTSENASPVKELVQEIN
jgi:hypothetical protein